LRIFGPQTMFARLMNKNLADGEAIVSPWISKAIETAQKKVEARNYDVRKQVVEYDDVMNDQRKVIYEQRADIMDSTTVGDVVVDMRAETINSIVGEACPPNSYPEQWDVPLLKERVAQVFGIEPPIDDWMKEEAVEPDMLVDRLQALADGQFNWGQQEEELPEIPDFITHHIDPFTGEDDSADIDAATGTVMSRLPPLQMDRPEMPSDLALDAPLSRNAPCPCGSGRKYKHCHGQI